MWGELIFCYSVRTDQLTGGRQWYVCCNTRFNGEKQSSRTMMVRRNVEKHLLCSLERGFDPSDSYKLIIVII